MKEMKEISHKIKANLNIVSASKKLDLIR